jgi:peptide chain release factor 1
MTERIEQFCYTKKDFKIDWFSGTGPGGQNRNKVQACVRITHPLSGLSATGQRDRSRTTNFRNAFNDLGARLKTWIEAQIRKQAPEAVKVTETIRTYHYADNRVVDHASRVRIAASELDKKFGDLVDARRSTIIDQLVGRPE